MRIVLTVFVVKSVQLCLSTELHTKLVAIVTQIRLFLMCLLWRFWYTIYAMYAQKVSF